MGGPRRLRVKKICECCGREFEVIDGSAQRFCSRLCKISNQTKPRIKKLCEVCEEEFEIPLNSTQRFCGNECKMISFVQGNKSEERRNSSRERMIQLNHNISNYPEWYENNRYATSESLSSRWKNPEFADHVIQAVKNNWKDPDYKRFMSDTFKKTWRDPDHAARITEAGRNNLIVYNRSEKGRETSGKIITEFNNSPEGKDHRRKHNQSLKMQEVRRRTMIDQIQSGVFGVAQRLLYKKLRTDYPLYFWNFIMEWLILLSEDITCRYVGSNSFYYLIDIAFIVNSATVLAIEVDGTMGHSSDEDLHRDKIRDDILLIEFGIPTIRIKNDEVFRNLDVVSKCVMSTINTVIGNNENC